MRNTRSTPASTAAASTTGSDRRRADDHLGHPGHARRNRRHEQRRGQRIAPAGHVAADALERNHALLDADARHRPHAPFLRPLRRGDDANRVRAPASAPPAPGRRLLRAGLDLRARHLERPAPAIERPRVRLQGRVAVRGARARRFAPRSSRWPCREWPTASAAPHFRGVGRLNDSDHCASVLVELGRRDGASRHLDRRRTARARSC